MTQPTHAHSLRPPSTRPEESPPATRSTVRRCRAVFGLPLIPLLVLSACAGDLEVDQPIPLYGDNPIEYPIELWDQGVEGETLLRVRVDENGAVDSVEVAETSGHAELDEAAIEGARKLRFQPGRKDGRRVKVWATIPVHFSKRPEPER